METATNEARGTLADASSDLLAFALQDPPPAVKIEGVPSIPAELNERLARYGPKGGAGGVVGILGPTRMPYGETVGHVRYVADVLTELVGTRRKPGVYCGVVFDRSGKSK